MQISKSDRAVAMIYLASRSAIGASESPDWPEERFKEALDMISAVAHAVLTDGRTADEAVELVRLVDAEAMHVAAGNAGRLA